MTSNHQKRILVIEDDDLFREAMRDTLGERYAICEAESADEALTALQKSMYDLVLLDINLPDKDGVELLRQIKERWSGMPVIMITAYDSVPQVVESIRNGAFNYLTKPIRSEELFLAIDGALEVSEMQSELEQRHRLQLSEATGIYIVGTSASIKRLRKEVQTIAASDAVVLIEGETGTGKELIARAIHAGSRRADKLYVAINCGGMPDHLVESELFGHKKGAFTGALQDSSGKFRLAHGGTLVFDEIGELSAEAQVKLLRALEEQQFYPLGGLQLVRVDVRIIASTNRPLNELIKQGKFREDLFFRINVCRIEVPPLRDRPADIMSIGEHFIEHYCRKFGKKTAKISNEAEQFLCSYNWPGNVRELRNVMERVALLLEGGTIEREHFYFMDTPAASTMSADKIKLPAGGLDLEELEKSLLLQALKLAKHNKSKAAKLLHLTPPTFYYRLEKYGLKDE